jgi:hypothetical protein
MNEEIRYPVCPHRNVPAAFDRFFGPDSGGIERFFPEAPSFRLDDTVWEVRVKGRRVLETLSEESKRVAHLVADAAVLACALFTIVSSTVRFTFVTKTAV